MVDASLNQVEIATPPLWHIDAVLGGGVHPIAYVAAFQLGILGNRAYVHTIGSKMR
jgi:hypothetical protein